VRTAEKLTVAGVAVLTALAAALHYGDAEPVLTFVVSTAALAGIAWLVALATEQVGMRFGPAVTGFLQSTLGNLPEFFIVVFALSAGQVTLAQTSIIGSIFANALLVLGLVIMVGAAVAEDGTMRFHHRLPRDTATLLLVSLFIIVIVGLSLATGDHASDDIEQISAIGAVCLLAVYGVWLFGYLRSPHRRGDPGMDEAEERPRISMAAATVLLAVSGAGAAFVSDWFVGSLQPSIDKLGISEAFAGLVIVAIAGNAVENVTGIVLARHGKPDLAISVVKNSVAQIAAFLYPALVLVSLLFASTLTFALAPVYIGALFLTALAVWQITGDGEALMFEGAALVAIYVVLAAFTLYE
jgi:Ca2+:H+ antiporter